MVRTVTAAPAISRAREVLCQPLPIGLGSKVSSRRRPRSAAWMEKGKLVIRGLAVEDLAPYTTFEDTVFLLWHDALPDAEALNRFSGELATHRELERHTLELLRTVAARRVHPMDALRMARASLRKTSLCGQDALVWSSYLAPLLNLDVRMLSMMRCDAQPTWPPP
jgi:hypothetical protein